MSQVIWDQDQPHTTAQFGPCLTLIWPHSPFSPMQPHSNPVQPCSNGNQWSERNKADIKMISMISQVIWDQDQLHMTAPSGPCSTLIQPHSPFSPMWPHSSPVWPHSPFSPMQEPHPEEMISQCSIARYTKMSSRVNCSIPDQVGTANSTACQ